MSHSEDYLEGLKEMAVQAKLSRREFIRLATALGFASSVASILPIAVKPRLNAEAASAVGKPTGHLRFLQGENLTGNWDPTQHTRQSNLRWEPLAFDYLVVTRLRDPEPSLATSWELRDRNTLRMHLRKGVKFHDGSTMTAEDVKASVEYYSGAISDKVLSKTWFPSPVRGRVVDELTVDLTTAKSKGSLLPKLANTPIMSARDMRAGNLLEKRYMGTGPFKWVEWRGDFFTLEAFMDYWAGPPKVQKVTVGFVTDPQARLTALQRGEASIIDRIGPAEIAAIKRDPSVGFTEGPYAEMIYCLMSAVRPPFKNNVALRQAIAWAIDRKTIVKDILDGHAIVPDSFLSPAHAGYAPTPNFPGYDLDQAARFLEKAGYPKGKGLKAIEFHGVLGFYANAKDIMTFIADSLRKIGIKVNLNLLEFAAWVQEIYHPELWEMMYSGWASGSAEPDNLLRAQYYTRGIETGFSDPEVDAALDREGEEPDWNRRKKLLAEELLPLLVRKMPNAPIYADKLVYGVRKEVQGLKVNPNGQMFLHQVSIKA